MTDDMSVIDAQAAIRKYSRRWFLGGTVACGLTGAAAVGLTTPRAGPLILTAGRGGAGLLRDLIEERNADKDAPPAVVDQVGRSAAEEREAMLLRADRGWGDVLLLDSVYVSEFAAGGLLAELPGDLAPEKNFVVPLSTCRRRPGDKDRLYAVPFNTDVGILFTTDRAPTGPQPVDLTRLIPDRVPAGSRRFLGQLGGKNEAFLVNVLEHALAKRPDLLDADGVMRIEAKAWNEALTPLRSALTAGRIGQFDSESATSDAFDRSGLYMRNWPFFGPPAGATGEYASQKGRIRALPLTTGVLGGQNLAVIAASPRRDEAIDLIKLLTSPQSQRDLIRNGLVPANKGELEDAAAASPLLAAVWAGLARARPRPVTPRYSIFSTEFQKSLGGLIDAPGDFQLSEDDMNKLRPLLEPEEDT